MKKHLTVTFFCLLLSAVAVAQKPEIKKDTLNRPILKNLADSLAYGWWDKNTQLGINFSQASFNDSWQGGGINNVALGLLLNQKSDYHKGKGVWSNDLQFQYGFINNKGQGTRKSVDRIFMDSKYSRKINDKLSWFGGLNFLSQFAGGYEYVDNEKSKIISKFFSPAFLSESFGVEYKPVNYFSLSFGGATFRETFVLDNEVFENTAILIDGKKYSYGVEEGNRMLLEMGFQGVASFDKDIAKNVNLKFRYQAFFAYAPEVKPVDHNINLIATAKINKYLNVNFSLIGIYDKDQIDKFQLSQGLAAGFSLKL
jgi:hypothetical protein